MEHILEELSFGHGTIAEMLEFLLNATVMMVQAEHYRLHTRHPIIVSSKDSGLTEVDILELEQQVQAIIFMSIISRMHQDRFVLRYSMILIAQHII